MRKQTALCLALVLALGTLSFGGAMAAEDVIDKDCVINEAVFERDWKKYSDFDVFERDLKDEEFKKELGSRSWEVQQYAEAAGKMMELEEESLRLQAEIILNGQMRREVREIKESLVTKLRSNLIKSFFRLSFLTAHYVKIGHSAGKSLGKAVTATSAETLPEGLELIKDAADALSKMMPEGSETVEKVGDTADKTKTILEALAASDEDAAIILMKEMLSLAEDKAKNALPSWDTVKLSPEDISILESQYMNNQALDQFLAESYAEDKLRSVRIRTEIPAESGRLREEMAEWEGEEKQRVRDMLVAGCLENKKKEAAQGHWERTSPDVQSLSPYDNENSKHTLSSGSGSKESIGSLGIPEKDRGYFKISYSWNEPKASYEEGDKLTLTISAKIDEWRNRGGNPGGWVRASIGAHALRDDDGHSDVVIICQDGEIVQSSDEKTVWIKLYGGREGDYFVLDITTPSGHVLYRYDWVD